MMWLPRLVVVACIGVTAGCANPAEPTLFGTGLVGTVLRGPVQPVCMPGVSCDAPFSASFGVYSGTQQVATFQSDAQGHFEVRLAPGDYLILLASSSMIIVPSSQPKQVTVGPVGLTTVQLIYDTGIR